MNRNIVQILNLLYIFDKIETSIKWILLVMTIFFKRKLILIFNNYIFAIE